jgi:hypothetical protein
MQSSTRATITLWIETIPGARFGKLIKTTFLNHWLVATENPRHSHNVLLEEMNETSKKQTRLLSVRYVLGQVADSEFVDWACDLLAQGMDSEHLRFLAGYSAHEIERDLDAFRDDLKATFEEMGVDLPSKPVAFSELACFICKRYLEGTLSYRGALSDLYKIWTETNYTPENRTDNRFDVWMYFDDSVSLVADGYDPLLEQFEGLNMNNQESYFRREAERFLTKYGPEAGLSPAGEVLKVAPQE